jgi:hypothetical protein
MEDWELKYQKGYEIAFLQVHLRSLYHASENTLKFQMDITKQCFENAVKDKRFSQEFIDKFNNGRDTI